MDVVHCPACGEENPARFRMCGFCGTSLLLPVVSSVPCPACGAENPAGFRFCGFCATPLDGSAPETRGRSPRPRDPRRRGAAAVGMGVPLGALGAAAVGRAAPSGAAPPYGAAPYPPPGYAGHLAGRRLSAAAAGYPPPGYRGRYPPRATASPALPPGYGYPPRAAAVRRPGQPPPGYPQPYPPQGVSAAGLPADRPGIRRSPVSAPPHGQALSAAAAGRRSRLRPVRPARARRPAGRDPAPTGDDRAAASRAARPDDPSSGPSAAAEAPRAATTAGPGRARRRPLPSIPRRSRSAPTDARAADADAPAASADLGGDRAGPHRRPAHPAPPSPRPTTTRCSTAATASRPLARSPAAAGHAHPRPPGPAGAPPVPPAPAGGGPGGVPGLRHAEEAAPRSVAPLASSEVRKIVTIIFSDLKGSTALTEKIDAEAINEVKERYFTSMAAEITRHGGKIEKYIGDAIMAVFGLPRAHEDDALRAVRAAYGMTVALDELNKDLLEFYGVEIAARTGVNTGEVVANSDPDAEQRLATGDAVNVAARLEQAAPANEVLIGEVTYSLVRATSRSRRSSRSSSRARPSGCRPTGCSTSATQRELERRRRGRAARRAETPQLSSSRGGSGRSASRGGARLDDGHRRGRRRQVYLARRASSSEVAVGDNRAARAMPAVRRRHHVLAARRGRLAPRPGSSTTTRPTRPSTRSARRSRASPAGAEIRDRARSRRSASRRPASRSRELFWGARKFLEALSRERPVVLCIEDVHNAEPTFLDLLDHLLDATAPQSRRPHRRDGPRSRLLEKRPRLGRPPTGRRSPMPAARAARRRERLVEVLLGGPVEDAVNERVVAASEGNPLFVEQLVSMLVDKGLVHRHDGRWTASGDLAARRGAADDPGAARRPPRRPLARGAGDHGAGVGHRARRSPSRRSRSSCPRRCGRPCRPPRRRSTASSSSTATPTSASEDEIYRFRNLMIKDADVRLAAQARAGARCTSGS